MAITEEEEEEEEEDGFDVSAPLVSLKTGSVAAMAITEEEEEEEEEDGFDVSGGMSSIGKSASMLALAADEEVLAAARKAEEEAARKAKEEAAREAEEEAARKAKEEAAREAEEDAARKAEEEAARKTEEDAARKAEAEAAAMAARIAADAAEAADLKLTEAATLAADVRLDADVVWNRTTSGLELLTDGTVSPEPKTPGSTDNTSLQAGVGPGGQVADGSRETEQEHPLPNAFAVEDPESEERFGYVIDASDLNAPYENINILCDISPTPAPVTSPSRSEAPGLLMKSVDSVNHGLIKWWVGFNITNTFLLNSDKISGRKSRQGRGRSGVLSANDLVELRQHLVRIWLIKHKHHSKAEEQRRLRQERVSFLNRGGNQEAHNPREGCVLAEEGRVHTDGLEEAAGDPDQKDKENRDSSPKEMVSALDMSEALVTEGPAVATSSTPDVLNCPDAAGTDEEETTTTTNPKSDSRADEGKLSVADLEHPPSGAVVSAAPSRVISRTSTADAVEGAGAVATPKVGALSEGLGDTETGKSHPASTTASRVGSRAMSPANSQSVSPRAGSGGLPAPGAALLKLSSGSGSRPTSATAQQNLLRSPSHNLTPVTSRPTSRMGSRAVSRQALKQDLTDEDKNFAKAEELEKQLSSLARGGEIEDEVSECSPSDADSTAPVPVGKPLKKSIAYEATDDQTTNEFALEPRVNVNKEMVGTLRENSVYGDYQTVETEHLPFPVFESSTQLLEPNADGERVQPSSVVHASKSAVQGTVRALKSEIIITSEDWTALRDACAAAWDGVGVASVSVPWLENEMGDYTPIGEFLDRNKEVLLVNIQAELKQQQDIVCVGGEEDAQLIAEQAQELADEKLEMFAAFWNGVENPSADSQVLMGSVVTISPGETVAIPANVPKTRAMVEIAAGLIDVYPIKHIIPVVPLHLQRRCEIALDVLYEERAMVERADAERERCERLKLQTRSEVRGPEVLDRLTGEKEWTAGKMNSPSSASQWPWAGENIEEGEERGTTTSAADAAVLDDSEEREIEELKRQLAEARAELDEDTNEWVQKANIESALLRKRQQTSGLFNILPVKTEFNTTTPAAVSGQQRKLIIDEPTTTGAEEGRDAVFLTTGAEETQPQNQMDQMVPYDSDINFINRSLRRSLVTNTAKVEALAEENIHKQRSLMHRDINGQLHIRVEKRGKRHETGFTDSTWFRIKVCKVIQSMIRKFLAARRVRRMRHIKMHRDACILMQKRVRGIVARKRVKERRRIMRIYALRIRKLAMFKQECALRITALFRFVGFINKLTRMRRKYRPVLPIVHKTEMRQCVLRVSRAVTKIQAKWRSKMGRRRVTKILRKRYLAARLIQRYWRKKYKEWKNPKFKPKSKFVRTFSKLLIQDDVKHHHKQVLHSSSHKLVEQEHKREDLLKQKYVTKKEHNKLVLSKIIKAMCGKKDEIDDVPSDLKDIAEVDHALSFLGPKKEEARDEFKITGHLAPEAAEEFSHNYRVPVRDSVYRCRLIQPKKVAKEIAHEVMPSTSQLPANLFSYSKNKRTFLQSKATEEGGPTTTLTELPIMGMSASTTSLRLDGGTGAESQYLPASTGMDLTTSASVGNFGASDTLPPLMSTSAPGSAGVGTTRGLLQSQSTSALPKDKSQVAMMEKQLLQLLKTSVSEKQVAPQPIVKKNSKYQTLEFLQHQQTEIYRNVTKPKIKNPNEIYVSPALNDPHRKKRKQLPPVVSSDKTAEKTKKLDLSFMFSPNVTDMN